MKAVTIIGGGLAGLALGIGLRQHHVPVRIFEAGTYPRHRVCGEFINGRGQETLRRLNLLSEISRLGAQAASRVAFFSDGAALGSFTLPTAATCIPRYVLDAFLAQHFVRLGGELTCGKRFTGNTQHEGEVRASGRVSHPITKGWRWFGLKAHADGVQLSADLEMHFLRDGYVGICRVAPDLVNVCGLFRSQPGQRRSGPDWKSTLSGPQGSPLFTKLQSAQWHDSSFSATSGLWYCAAPRGRSAECMIGDAFSLIAPMTGNGMSIAFESAEIALPLLVGYARAERAWEAVRVDLDRQLRARFIRRFRCARVFQHLIFRPFATGSVLPVILRSPRLVNLCYRLTH